jgi:potassium efflux system protein
VLSFSFESLTVPLPVKAVFLFFLLVLHGSADPLSSEQIDSRIKANESAKDDAVAAESAKIWNEALLALKAADESILSEKKARADLAKLEKLPALTLPAEQFPGASLSDQEALFKKIVALIEESEDFQKKLEDKAKQSSQLGADLNTEETKIQSELTALEIPAVASGELELAKYQKAVQSKRRLEAKLREIKTKKDFRGREAELHDDRILRRNTYEKGLGELREKLEVTIQELKKKESEDTRKVLDFLATEFAAIPQLTSIVSEVRELRVVRDDLQDRLRKAKAYDAGIQVIRERIAEQFGHATRRITLLEEAKLGVDDETGLLLRQQRSRLPSVDEVSAELRLNLERAAQAEIALMKVADRILASPLISEKQITALLAKNRGLSRERVEALLKVRGETLKKLKEDYRKLTDELSEGTEAAKYTIIEIEDYSNFIDKRLLWIKSTKPLHWTESIAEWGRILALFSPTTLAKVGQSIRDNIFREIVGFIFAVPIALGVFFRRRRLRDILKKTSLEATRRNCTSLTPTLKNIGTALLLSIWFPLLIWIVADLIETSMAWKIGLVRLSGFLFVTSLFLKFSSPNGLFVSHFKIHFDRAALLYQNLKWLTLIAPPFVFLVPALTLMDGSSSSGRVIFILGMLLLFGFCHHLFHPKRSFLQKEGKSSGFTKACYLLIMAIPIVFAVGAGLGYFASVLTLRDQVGATAALLVVAFVLIRFLTRWTLVSRRALAISQALRRRETAIAEREHKEANGAEREGDLPSLDQVKAEAVDVVEVEEQTTQLLRLATYVAVFFALWAIWASTLPALSVLDTVELWKDGSAVTETRDSPSLIPGMSTQAEEPLGKIKKIIPEDDGRITLQDLFLTILFFALTLAAARNIPSLLSLTLFNRIKLGPGGNFALTTTVRYVIILIGIVVALAQIGVTWGKVQWLAAAVTLGIGFGLQEIFANFVAGIIMLFERPIRLGDIVTVGEISGKVTQIKIRATTIQQFNNRELLVPNKEFITSQLVNWTLKDSILRFEIPVGIAYGSDTEKASRVLRNLVDHHEKVLTEPGPQVLFMSFGNSTLDFQVRGFVATVDDLLVTQSELHFLIDNAFREAGIEIAFPQQDIHLRSLPEGMKIVSE